MLIRDGKEYRNLQQQVAENTDDIAELKESGGGGTIDAYTKAESDAKYQTKTAMSDYYTKTAADDKFQTQSGMSTYATKTEVNAKQDTLISGTNIKTINGTSVLGSGDIIIGEGGTTVTGGTGIIVSNEGEISIDTSVVAELSDIPTVPTKTSQLTNDSGFITGINSTDVTTALGYTPGTSNFSGDYDDLTDKPTIPAEVSGTNDGTNWTSLTIGSDTYGLASGGSGTQYVPYNLNLTYTYNLALSGEVRALEFNSTVMLPSTVQNTSTYENIYPYLPIKNIFYGMISIASQTSYTDYYGVAWIESVPSTSTSYINYNVLGASSGSIKKIISNINPNSTNAHWILTKITY